MALDREREVSSCLCDARPPVAPGTCGPVTGTAADRSCVARPSGPEQALVRRWPSRDCARLAAVGLREARWEVDRCAGVLILHLRTCRGTTVQPVRIVRCGAIGHGPTCEAVAGVVPVRARVFQAGAHVEGGERRPAQRVSSIAARASQPVDDRAEGTWPSDGAG